MNYSKIKLFCSILTLLLLTACGAPKAPKMQVSGWKPINGIFLPTTSSPEETQKIYSPKTEKTNKTHNTD